jgi:hypothetical protein
VHGELELSEETRDRMAELRALSDRAEAGDKEARRKLRLMVRASSAEVVGRASDVGRRAGRVLASSAAGGDPLALLVDAHHAARGPPRQPVPEGRGRRPQAALTPLPHPAVADTRERHQALLRGHKGASQGEKAAGGATVRVSAQAAALRGIGRSAARSARTVFSVAPSRSRTPCNPELYVRYLEANERS